MGTRDEARTGETAVIAVEPGETAAPPIGGEAQLVCAAGPDVGRTFRLVSAGPFVIGRGRDADVALTATEVSRHHAEIRRRQPEYVLIDLGSRNGTTVNGISVQRDQPRVLRPGDHIQLGGGALLVFTIADELRDRALRLNQLDTLAMVTGGIVHDFKNSLNVVMINADLLESELAAAGASPAWREMVHDIGIAARGGLECAQRLLYFARRDVDADGWELIPAGSLVEEVVGLLRRSLEGGRVRVEIQLVNPGAIRGNRYELHHAILNLVLNARDAMPGGGQLTIRAEAVTVSRADTVRYGLAQPGDYVEISVTDTGTGMDDATQARVFEPFFTTKTAGKGTGLGLSSVFGIVRDHGGNVTVTSAPGKGARFRVLVPRAAVAGEST